MSYKLSGKIALVTGGSSGLGFATAMRFLTEGAYVFITGRRQAELDTAVKELGPNVTAIRGDISNLADLDRLFAIIKEQKGRLDILFANAGRGEFAPLGQITEEHFDKTFDINVKGTLFTVQKALPLMPDGAAIVVNGSMVSIKGLPAFSVYAATKAALRSFARTWAVDLKDRKIRVNVVSPGTVVTPAYKSELGLATSRSRNSRRKPPPSLHWAARARPTKSQRQWFSWRQTTAATSPASSCSWTEAQPKSEEGRLRTCPTRRSHTCANRYKLDGRILRP